MATPPVGAMAIPTKGTPAPKGRLGTILQNAERDLDNSEWPGMMGLVLHPVRDVVLLPSIRTVQEIAPSLPPSLDHAASTVVDAAFGALKFTYGILPHTPSFGDLSMDEIRRQSLQAYEEMRKRFGVAPDIVSLILSGVGMILGITLDIFTNTDEKIRTFADTIHVFVAFLLPASRD